MSDWSRQHPPEGSDQDPWKSWDANPPPLQYGAADNPSWDEPTSPAAPAAPAVPLEMLGPWTERSWTLLTVSFRDMLLIQALVFILIVATAGLLAGPMMAGYFRYAIRKSQGLHADFNDLFSALSASPGPTLLAGLAWVGAFLASISILAVLDMIVGQVPYVGFVLRAFVDLSGALFIAAGLGLFVLVLPLIHDRGATLLQAFEACQALLLQNKGAAVLLGAVIGGPPLIGFLVCGVGLLLGGPLGVLIGAHAFISIFGAPAGPEAGSAQPTTPGR